MNVILNTMFDFSPSKSIIVSKEQYIPYRDSEGWHGLVHRGWQDFTGGLPGLEAWLAAQAGRRIVTHPSRTVDLLTTPRGVIFAKHFLKASDKSSLGNSLKWYLRPSRALYILKIGEELTAAGFAVPETVIAVRRRSRWGWPEDYHLSLDCREQTVNIRLKEFRAAGIPDDSADVRGVLREMAVSLVRLHHRGFVHGDCLPGNMCVLPDSLLLLDNDRTAGGYGAAFCRAKQRNLEQCAKFLAIAYPSTGNAGFFLDCYAEADAWPDAQRRSRLAAIEKRIQHKMENI